MATALWRCARRCWKTDSRRGASFHDYRRYSKVVHRTEHRRATGRHPSGHCHATPSERTIQSGKSFTALAARHRPPEGRSQHRAGSSAAPILLAGSALGHKKKKKKKKKKPNKTNQEPQGL